MLSTCFELFIHFIISIRFFFKCNYLFEIQYQNEVDGVDSLVVCWILINLNFMFSFIEIHVDNILGHIFF